MNLLTDRYDQVLGLAIWGPWALLVLVAAWAICLRARLWWAITDVEDFKEALLNLSKRKKAPINPETFVKFKEPIQALDTAFSKLEAEARELQAALDENERKWMARWTAKYPPPRPDPLLSTPPTLGKTARNRKPVMMMTEIDGSGQKVITTFGKSAKKAIPKKKKAPKKK